MVGSIVTLVLQGILSAIFRNVQKNAWWVQIIRWVLQSGWNYFQAGSETIHRTEVAQRVAKAAMFAMCLVGLAGVLNVVTACTSVTPSMTSAQTANGKSWPLCVEADFVTSIPIVKNWSVLACATTDATLAEVKQGAIDNFKAEHPDAKLVSETRLQPISLEQFKATHPEAKVVTQ